jgi:hypothetical protein
VLIVLAMICSLRVRPQGGYTQIKVATR